MINGQTLIPTKNSLKKIQMEIINDDRVGIRGILVFNYFHFRIRLQNRKSQTRKISNFEKIQ